MDTLIPAGRPMADVEEGRAWWFFDALVIVHSGYEETGGHLTFTEGLARPGRFTPLHVHPDQEEAWYVLDGRMRVYLGRDVLELGPGQYARAPRGIPHTLTYVGSTPTRVLGWVTGPFDAFVREASQPAKALRLPTDDEAVMPDPSVVSAAAQRAGIKPLGPPGMLPTELAEYAERG